MAKWPLVCKRDVIIGIPKTSYTLRENCPAPCGPCFFPPIWTIFELFHDDWAKIVTSIVFTRNTPPPPGGHLHEDWASTVTSTVFELSRGINGTNVLNKFHEGQTINVASGLFTMQMLTTDNGRSQKLTMSTLCSGELKMA
ncbi:hypothetical protein DPMN_077930 [Dreissena polymorpha]|uniref:Uncharacterized protein n=1 Tax=Dreissena polymorpha TaxID=45954 RepID=A0A9D4BPS2_DREPO|nr:hypothetical protein DPMN_077930 [Dreissena polymorpha]